MHEDYIYRDQNEIKALASFHTLNRQEHLDMLKNMVRTIEGNIHNVSSLDDLRTIEEQVSSYKKRVDDVEIDLKSKDSRVNESISVS